MAVQSRMLGQIGFCSLMLLLPACLGSFSTKRPQPATEFAAPTARVVPVPVKTDFGEYPSVPGETIPLNPTLPPIPVESTPIQEPTAPELPRVPQTVTIAAVPLTDPPLVAALRAQLEGRTEQVAQHLKQLEQPNQDLVFALLPALTKSATMNLNQPEPHESAQLVSQIDRVSAVLAKRASLTIDKAVFCRSVKNFGHFDPHPLQDGMPEAFRRGEIYILYVEIGNVPCETASQNGIEGYLTRLNCTLELRDLEGKIIELTDRSRKQVSALQETKNDFSRSPLRDYFMLFWFAAPSRAGQYSVKFTVRDASGGREVSRRVPFRVQ